MAKGKQRPSFEKRRRERDQQAKRAEKRDRRQVRKDEKAEAEPNPNALANAPDGPSLNRDDGEQEGERKRPDRGRAAGRAD